MSIFYALNHLVANNCRVKVNQICIGLIYHCLRNIVTNIRSRSQITVKYAKRTQQDVVRIIPFDQPELGIIQVPFWLLRQFNAIGLQEPNGELA